MSRHSALCVSVAVACLLVPAVEGFPGFRATLPNGMAVPSADGGTCQPFGHEGCYPGAPRNAFGLDFAASGYAWTQDLCMLDSDGDGLTNGEELGDPCCLWTAGEEPTLDVVSHPGIAESLLLTPPDSCTLCSDVLPAVNLTALCQR